MARTEIKRLVAFEQFYYLQSGKSISMTKNIYQEFLSYDEFKQNNGTYQAAGVCESTINDWS